MRTLNAPSTEVDITDAQSRQLAPPQTGVREDEDQQPEPLPCGLGPDGFGQRRNLLVREELLVRLRLPWQLQPHGWVGRDTPIIDSKLQPCREHVDDLPHRAGALGSTEPRCPLLRLQPPEVGERDVPERRDDVVAHNALHAIQRGFSQIRSAVEPRSHPVGDRDPRPRRVDVSPSALGDFDRGEK